MKRIELKDIACILDDDIAKAKPRLPRLGESKVEYYEEVFKKALTFDPLSPHQMRADSQYYNPYRQLQDGSFVPYETQHWVSQGKSAEGYRTTDDFYRQASGKSSSFRRSMREAVNDLMKAKVAKIGEVHTRADGTKWKKVREGQGENNWEMVSEGRGKAGPEDENEKQLKKIEQEIMAKKKAPEEKKKDAVEEIRDVIAKRKEEEKSKKRDKKEVIDTFREVFDELKDTPGFEQVSEKLKIAGESLVISKELKEKTERQAIGEGYEVNLSEDELKDILEFGQYGIVSGGKNPNSEEEKDMSPKEEARRQEELRADLVARGFAFTKLKGFYGGEEDSYLILAHNAERNEMLELGEKYNQDSVIYANKGKQELHYTVGKNKGRVRLGAGFSETPDATDEYSILPEANFKFSLKFDWDKTHAWEDVKDNPDMIAEGRVIETKVTKDNSMFKPRNKMESEEEFHEKPGKQLTRDEIESYIAEFEKDFANEAGKMDNLVREAGATEFSGRLKDGSSLLNKMLGKLSERPISTATDIIGTRALTSTIKDQEQIVASIKKNYDLVELEDFANEGRPDGYRAVHLLFRTETGKIGEMQIKTHRQQIFSGFTHDSIYKGSDTIKNNEEVQKYTKELSDYLYSLDSGEKDSKDKRPKEPQILLDNNILFPWEEVEMIETIGPENEEFRSELVARSLDNDLMKAESKLKFYVTIRDKNKKNGNTHEFESFEKAKKFRDLMRSKGHKGELPIGHARSKDEYLKTFSEYKKGPGSRGGNVVGYTKSGKPKYGVKQ